MEKASPPAEAGPNCSWRPASSSGLPKILRCAWTIPNWPNTRVTLQRGDALIEVVQLAEDNRIQVGLAETTTEFARAGLYRFGTERKMLRVYGGEALVRSGATTASVKRGMEVDLDTGPNPASTQACP